MSMHLPTHSPQDPPLSPPPNSPGHVTESPHAPQSRHQPSQRLIERLRALDQPDQAPAPAEAPRSRWRSKIFGAPLVLGLAIIGIAIWSRLTLFSDPFKSLNLDYQKVERGKVTFTV